MVRSKSICIFALGGFVFIMHHGRRKKKKVWPKHTPSHGFSFALASLSHACWFALWEGAMTTTTTTNQSCVISARRRGWNASRTYGQMNTFCRCWTVKFIKRWVKRWKRGAVNDLLKLQRSNTKEAMRTGTRPYCPYRWVIIWQLLLGRSCRGYLFRLLSWLCSHCKWTLGFEQKPSPPLLGDLGLVFEFIYVQTAKPTEKHPLFSEQCLQSKRPYRKNLKTITN